MLAHIGLMIVRASRMHVGKLKPLQLATISLVEDARVERLAAAEMPGSPGCGVRSTLPVRTDASCDRAHGTVVARAGRSGFSRRERLGREGTRGLRGGVRNGSHDRAWVRRIGGMLGNDLGQMRLQFDARSYVVQPAYRDDNLGLWDFGDEEEPSFEMQAGGEGARIEQRESDDGRREEELVPDAPVGRAALRRRRRPARRPLPEFDYAVGRERPGWCSVREPLPGLASPLALRRRIEARPDLTQRLGALIRASKVSRQQRVRRQIEGEYLDVDAAINRPSRAVWRDARRPDLRALPATPSGLSVLS